MMEKYGIQEDDRISGLRDEEAQLMSKMGQIQGGRSKLASSEQSQIESRLHQVRAAISDHDLNRKRDDKG